MATFKNFSVTQLSVAGFVAVGVFSAGVFFPVLRIGLSGGLSVAIYVLLRRYRFPEKPVFPVNGKDLSKQDFFVFFALVAVSLFLMLIYYFLDGFFGS